MNADAKKAKWFQFRQQSWGGFTGLPNRLVDGPAFSALNSAASVRGLVWFWQQAIYEKQEKKRGASSYVGRVEKIINNGEISFTYQAAGWRGLNARRFSRVIKELFRLGFIDIHRHGRGVKGEYTKFAISTRWMKYGTTEWKEISFPDNDHAGFSSEEFKKKQREQRHRGKNNGHKRPLPTDTDVRYSGAELLNNGHERPLKTTLDSNSQRTRTSASIDLAMHSETSKRRNKEGPKDGLKVKSTATAQFRPDDSIETSFWAEDEAMVMAFDRSDATN